MRVRHDDLRPRDPARARHAEPARRAGDPKHAAACGAHARVAQQRRVGGIDSGQRAGDLQVRVDALDGVEEAIRRHPPVQLAEDARALHLLTQLRLARDVEGHGAADPDERETRDGAEQDAAHRVEDAQRRHHEEARTDRAPRDRTQALQQRREQHRPRQRHDRRPRRLVARQELRRDLRADDRADDDPRQPEQPRQESPPQPVQRQEHDHGDREPVEPRHVRSVETPSAGEDGAGFQARMLRPWGA